MTKEELRKKIVDCDDAVVTYRSINSNKLKYNVVTCDFRPEYIRDKINKTKESKDTLLVFCWDTDSFRLLKPENITNILPLSVLLKR